MVIKWKKLSRIVLCVYTHQLLVSITTRVTRWHGYLFMVLLFLYWVLYHPVKHCKFSIAVMTRGV